VREFRTVIVVGALLIAVLLITALQVYYIKLPSVTMAMRFLLISALTINIVALLTVMFFVGKNLFKLFMERRHRILGYRFRTRLMVVFGTLILIPSLFLFIVASGLATNYLKGIFSPEMKRPLVQSIELARLFYDLERQRLLAAARNVAHGAGPPGEDISVQRYARVPPAASELIRDGFDGQEATEVVTGERGDTIRAVVPERVGGKVVGVVVLEEMLPASISESAERLRDLHEDYLKLESFQEPLRVNYVLTLGFVTVMLVFTALWISLRISKSITVPIQSLAMATAEVSSGNLDVQVSTQSKDEVGLLIDSFNQMVTQLRDSKHSLEHAYEESDRRRLYLENILQHINSGVLFLDSTGTIVTVNRAACAILQVTPEEVLSKDYRQFIDGLRSDDLSALVGSMEGKEIRGVTREVHLEIGGRKAKAEVRSEIATQPQGAEEVRQND
jgi:two-component system nitrogen regulation sensor histidine kinase NtrY